MSRFYFHLSAPDQVFQDDIGSDVSDLAAAHSKAVLLVDRVMMLSRLSDRAPCLQRWTVKVADEKQRPVITVIFPANFVRWKDKAAPLICARSLLMRLDAMLRVDASPQIGAEPEAEIIETLQSSPASSTS